MATRKQRAANRRNAQLSTGPRTPEGKAVVRLNALKHGLTAQDAVIFGEDDGAFNEFLDASLDQLQPATPLETALAHQIVMAQWRIARIRRLETGLFGLGHVDNEEDMNQDYTNLPPRSRLAYVFQKNSEVLATLSRYEARIERAFYRALHEIQSLQAARPTEESRSPACRPCGQVDRRPQAPLIRSTSQIWTAQGANQRVRRFPATESLRFRKRGFGAKRAADHFPISPLTGNLG